MHTQTSQRQLYSADRANTGRACIGRNCRAIHFLFLLAQNPIHTNWKCAYFGIICSDRSIGYISWHGSILDLDVCAFRMQLIIFHKTIPIIPERGKWNKKTLTISARRKEATSKMRATRTEQNTRLYTSIFRNATCCTCKLNSVSARLRRAENEKSRSSSLSSSVLAAALFGAINIVCSRCSPLDAANIGRRCLHISYQRRCVAEWFVARKVVHSMAWLTSVRRTHTETVHPLLVAACVIAFGWRELRFGRWVECGWQGACVSQAAALPARPLAVVPHRAARSQGKHSIARAAARCTTVWCWCWRCWACACGYGQNVTVHIASTSMLPYAVRRIASSRCSVTLCTRCKPFSKSKPTTAEASVCVCVSVCVLNGYGAFGCKSQPLFASVTCEWLSVKHAYLYRLPIRKQIRTKYIPNLRR